MRQREDDMFPVFGFGLLIGALVMAFALSFPLNDLRDRLNHTNKQRFEAESQLNLLRHRLEIERAGIVRI